MINSLLNELFDQPVAWTWTGRTAPTPALLQDIGTWYRSYSADFTVPRADGTPQKYQTTFLPDMYRDVLYYSLEFGIHPDQRDYIKSPLAAYKIQGNVEYRSVVFATVVDILKAFLRMKPTMVIFTADHDEPTRVKLYTRMFKHAQEHFPDYRTQTVDRGYKHEYILMRKDVDADTTRKLNDRIQKNTLDDLNEVFTQPFTWTWTPDITSERGNHDWQEYGVSESFTATFRVPTRDHVRMYSVGFDLTDIHRPYLWEISFSMKTVHGEVYTIVNDSEHVAQIFATIFAIIKEFVEKRPSVTRFEFSGDEPSRQKLYTRLVKNVSKLLPDWKGYHPFSDAFYLERTTSKAAPSHTTITEAFDAPYKWSWHPSPKMTRNVDDDNAYYRQSRYATFTIDQRGSSVEYVVEFVPTDARLDGTTPLGFNLSFGPMNPNELPTGMAHGSGAQSGVGRYTVLGNVEHPQRVFATVIDILKAFMKEQRPNAVCFETSEDDEKNAQKRLYLRFIQRAVSLFAGYTAKSMSPSTFAIYRTTMSPEQVDQLSQYLRRWEKSETHDEPAVVSEMLTELFNKPLTWEWVKRDSDNAYLARFVVPIDGVDTPYELWFGIFNLFEKCYEAILNIADDLPADHPLYHASQYKLLNTKHDMSAVFSTVVDIFKAFIKEVKPNGIRFDDFVAEPSRTKLYKRFVANVKSNIPGYWGASRPKWKDSPSNYFYIIRDGFTDEKFVPTLSETPLNTPWDGASIHGDAIWPDLKQVFKAVPSWDYLPRPKFLLPDGTLIAGEGMHSEMATKANLELEDLLRDGAVRVIVSDRTLMGISTGAPLTNAQATLLAQAPLGDTLIVDVLKPYFQKYNSKILNASQVTSATLQLTVSTLLKK